MKNILLLLIIVLGISTYSHSQCTFNQFGFRSAGYNYWDANGTRFRNRSNCGYGYGYGGGFVSTQPQTTVRIYIIQAPTQPLTTQRSMIHVGTVLPTTQIIGYTYVGCDVRNTNTGMIQTAYYTWCPVSLCYKFFDWRL